MRAEVSTALKTLKSVDGMEARILQELLRNEVRRKKEDRIARKPGDGVTMVVKEEGECI